MINRFIIPFLLLTPIIALGQDIKSQQDLDLLDDWTEMNLYGKVKQINEKAFSIRNGGETTSKMMQYEQEIKFDSRGNKYAITFWRSDGSLKEKFKIDNVMRVHSLRPRGRTSGRRHPLAQRLPKPRQSLGNSQKEGRYSFGQRARRDGPTRGVRRGRVRHPRQRRRR